MTSGGGPARRREDHRAGEERAHRRELEHLERRFSSSPKVYYALLLAVLAAILAIALAT